MVERHVQTMKVRDMSVLTVHPSVTQAWPWVQFLKPNHATQPIVSRHKISILITEPHNCIPQRLHHTTVPQLLHAAKCQS